MPQYHQFISVMSPVQEDEDLVVSFVGDDGTGEGSISVPLTEGMSEEQAALAIRDKLREGWAELGLLFDGAPFFSGEEFTTTYRSERAEHVVSVFSQNVFSLSVESVVRVVSGTHPVYMTLGQAKTRGPLFGQSWVDQEQDPYTDDEITEILLTMSELMVEEMGGFLLLAPYVHEESCSGSDAVFYGRTPVLSWDQPRIIEPWEDRVTETVTVTFPKAGLNMVGSKGMLEFLYSQHLVAAYHPFTAGNVFAGAYSGGYTRIPRVLGTIMMRYSTATQIDPLVEGTLQHGTFRVGLRSPDKIRESLRVELSGFAVYGDP